MSLIRSTLDDIRRCCSLAISYWHKAAYPRRAERQDKEGKHNKGSWYSSHDDIL